MLVTAGWILAGCSTISSMDPVGWWHQREGGKIAEERPPPPGANQPYPNMSTVPARPTPPNQDEMKKLTEALVADRTNAQHAAQSAPLADPSSPTASPSLFGVGTAPPPPPAGVVSQSGAPATGSASPVANVASASMPAVSAPAPSPAPRKAVQSTPLEAPPAQSAQAQAPPGSTQVPAAPAQSTQAAAATASGGTPPAEPAASPTSSVALAGPQPDLPAAPPPRPAAAGAPPVTPAAPTPMPAPPSGASTSIVFLEQTSNLTQPAADEVKAFAAKRGNATISVIGYGDSTSSDPDAQSAALTLGLSRAQSIVDALKVDGVPGNAIRVSAEASGRGASLQLLH
jgi:outer membrane protein OmpA-like peptidoglycan-associated protein